MISATIADRSALRALDRLSRARTRDLAEVVGAVHESQVRRRIADEKTAPDGSAWAPWAADYEGGDSLLLRSGSLLDSIAFVVGDDDVAVGSPLIYAGAHERGADTIPARPFLGVSAANADELAEAVEGWLAAAAEGRR